MTKYKSFIEIEYQDTLNSPVLNPKDNKWYEITGGSASSSLNLTDPNNPKIEIKIWKKMPKEFVPMAILHEIVEQLGDVFHPEQATELQGFCHQEAHRIEKEVFGKELFEKSRKWAKKNIKQDVKKIK